MFLQIPLFLSTQTSHLGIWYPFPFCGVKRVDFIWFCPRILFIVPNIVLTLSSPDNIDFREKLCFAGFRWICASQIVWAACAVSVLSLEVRSRYGSYATTRSGQKTPRKCRRFTVPLKESTWKRLHGVSYRRGTFIKHRNRKAKSVAGRKQASTLVSPKGVALPEESVCTIFETTMNFIGKIID